jgi:ATP-dependent helicase HrpA/adenine-specific DNA-methyltransferase
MWSLLRDRRFLALKFRRQHPVGRFVIDFFCADLLWAVELDGGQHNTDEARMADASRSNELAARGITVTRFWNNEVLEALDAVLGSMALTAQTLQSRERRGTLTPTLSQRERASADIASRIRKEKE